MAALSKLVEAEFVVAINHTSSTIPDFKGNDSPMPAHEGPVGTSTTVVGNMAHMAHCNCVLDNACVHLWKTVVCTRLMGNDGSVESMQMRMLLRTGTSGLQVLLLQDKEPGPGPGRGSLAVLVVAPLVLAEVQALQVPHPGPSRDPQVFRPPCVLVLTCKPPFWPKSCQGIDDTIEPFHDIPSNFQVPPCMKHIVTHGLTRSASTYQ
jgi:hypothetical protein